MMNILRAVERRSSKEWAVKFNLRTEGILSKYGTA
jgi:hypothetical protein